MKKLRVLLFSFMVVVISGQLLQARDDTPVPPAEKRGEMREKLGILRAWKLIDELKLTQEQSAKVFPLMTEFDKKREELEERNRRTLSELSELLKQDRPSEKKIVQLLAQLEKDEGELQTARKNFLDKAASILSAEQRARLALFELKFRRQLEEVLLLREPRMRDTRGQKLRERNFPPDLDEKLKKFQKHMEKLERNWEPKLREQIQRLERQIEEMQRRLESVLKESQ